MEPLRRGHLLWMSGFFICSRLRHRTPNDSADLDQQQQGLTEQGLADIDRDATHYSGMDKVAVSMPRYPNS